MIRRCANADVAATDAIINEAAEVYRGARRTQPQSPATLIR